MVTQVSAAQVRSGFERLPTEERVCVCTVDGERVRCFGGEVRERVVRCRECRFAQELCDGMYDCNGPMVQTWDYYNDEPLRNPVPPDGFCAWGIEMED